MPLLRSLRIFVTDVLQICRAYGAGFADKGGMRRTVRGGVDDPGAKRETQSPMKKTTFPLSEVYRRLEPGPVVLLTTARAGRSICLRQKLHSPENKCPPGKSGHANFKGDGG